MSTTFPQQGTKSTFQPRATQSQPASAAEFSWSDPGQRNPAIAMIVGTALLVVAYFNMFSLTSAAWSNPLYSHGYLVPVFALGLMWIRFQPFAWVSPQERWIGLGILTAALLVRVFAANYDMNPLDRLSFVAALFGVFLMVGGWHVIRWAGPAVGFLLFMFPLPTILEHSLLWNLQKVATIASTFTLQTLGISAYRTGNVIRIDELELGVVDACSGLRMLTIFCALAVAMVFLVDRPWWDKFIILLSAIPIALLVNIIRITVTALLFMQFGESEAMQTIAHDYAGYFMMPLALGILWIELQILSRLTVPEEAAQLRPVGHAGRGSAIPAR